MPAPIFSRPFISHRGLSGGELRVLVPIDHVYIVRAVAVYANTGFDTVDLVFKNFTTGATHYYKQWHPTARFSDYLDAHIAFSEGQEFGFSVSASSFSDGADVFAGGYDLRA